MIGIFVWGLTFYLFLFVDSGVVSRAVMRRLEFAFGKRKFQNFFLEVIVFLQTAEEILERSRKMFAIHILAEVGDLVPSGC